ncbi:MAG: hypothetical protein EBU18_05285 [Rhodobacteraceae bacterium]|nr:hypothetical protein [Paracoccaceae bacterium]
MPVARRRVIQRLGRVHGGNHSACGRDLIIGDVEHVLPAGANHAPAEPVEPLNEVEMEAFRELVGKIVRDELKGSLGEKITTNIRKMVRREIAIALKDMNIK